MDKSELTTCIIRFFNNTDNPEDTAWLKLVKPGFTTSQVLIPEQESCFLVMEYDYCIVTDIHGKPIESDRFTLLLNEIAA